jgi:hypothetical protein
MAPRIYFGRPTIPGNVTLTSPVAKLDGTNELPPLARAGAVGMNLEPAIGRSPAVSLAAAELDPTAMLGSAVVSSVDKLDATKELAPDASGAAAMNRDPLIGLSPAVSFEAASDLALLGTAAMPGSVIAIFSERKLDATKELAPAPAVGAVTKRDRGIARSPPVSLAAALLDTAAMPGSAKLVSPAAKVDCVMLAAPATGAGVCIAEARGRALSEDISLPSACAALGDGTSHAIPAMTAETIIKGPYIRNS